MKPFKDRQGTTLIEVLAAVAIIGIFIVAAVLYFSKNAPMVQRMRQHQQMQTDSRSCIDNILQMLRNGKARTVVISTPNVTPLVPNSRIEFALHSPLASGATNAAIYLDNGTVYSLET